LFIPGIVISALFLFFVLKEDINRLHIEDRFIDFTKQTNTIIKNQPNKKFSVYHCGKKDRNRSQAIAFFLYNKNLLNTNGVRIEIKGSDCFLKNGWFEITPENIYKETVEWY